MAAKDDVSYAGATRVVAFAVTLAILPVHICAKSTMSVVDARSTTKQRSSGGVRTQIIEATIQNDSGAWITPAHPVVVRIEAAGARTATPGIISRLAPGERAFVQIGIVNDDKTPAGTKANGKIVVDAANGDPTTFDAPLVLGVPRYTEEASSLQSHEAPDWFDDAKFGIFIHWGVYSVPAYSRVGDYAEWYWHSIHEHDSVDYKHQLTRYGTNSRYDDFIPLFKAERFDPKAWVDLFHDAGARYFVLTSKHHEGFALFKTATTNRNAVDLGPHRDLVAALFNAARTYHPNDLHPGLYYSLYEWYNPAFTGKSVAQWYSGEPVPYTGMKPIRSYVDDHMLPQMREIIDQYHPQIIWCDGEWERPSEYWHDAGVIAHYYNAALDRAEGVAIDDRCRVTGGNNEDNNVVFDFSTPEYTTYDHTRVKKWEASRGMGYSYGYNAAEEPKDYKTSAELIAFLVDMVSKNGNFLLDIGPKADGTIPEVMQSRLHDIGSWLRVNGEAIYGSHYWWRTSEDGNLRFTLQQNKAFYVISLVPPLPTMEVHAPIPIADGDTITLLGYNGPPLKWRRYGEDVLVDVPARARASGRFAWTFRVNWK